MTETNPIELRDTAIEAARAGGKVLQDWVGRFSVREKRRADLVTEADHESQQVIFDLISERYPNHGFLGEEGLNKDPIDSDYRWVIDPLDGTSNYVHGFPYYAVSIAVQKGDTLVASVVLDPTRNETFSAARGHGAMLNGETISVSGEAELERSMGMASLPVGADHTDPAVQRFLTAINHLQTVQRTGSAALNLASIASGRLDLFWSTSLKPWDMAAGVLLVEEAGGSVTNLKGDKIDIMVPDILVAGSDKIAGELISVFSSLT